VRDLAAEGLIQAILVYAPDRLSRRYAHQILLIEELARAGVETLFVRAPRGSTPEDELLVQFQGMIAEYERAQILERSRRGKRHRARQGEVSVLSGAPFGYHFIRKTDHSAAYYEIDEEQARVVRRVFELYGVDGLSIGAIAHLLNEQAIPTCKRRGRWERSTVWGMLRNPAYKGQACFGKTTIAPRQRITRPIRLRGGVATRNSASHERPREDWITIPVPPIVSEETFALAQERLEANKAHAPRRTVTPSVVQGLVSCAKCGYALSDIDAIERTCDPLLSMSRFRRLAAAFRLRLQQPPGASGSSGRGRVGGSCAVARKSSADPERARTAARSRARGRPDQTA
jgi:site-specific DNA recombinase